MDWGIDTCSISFLFSNFVQLFMLNCICLTHWPPFGHASLGNVDCVVHEMLKYKTCETVLSQHLSQMSMHFYTSFLHLTESIKERHGELKSIDILASYETKPVQSFFCFQSFENKMLAIAYWCLPLWICFRQLSSSSISRWAALALKFSSKLVDWLVDILPRKLW